MSKKLLKALLLLLALMVTTFLWGQGVLKNKTVLNGKAVLTFQNFPPLIGISPTSIAYGSVMSGLFTYYTVVTVTNTGQSNIAITSITITSDYAQTNNCPGTLLPATNCQVTVYFKPTIVGADNGTLTINDNAQGGPHTVTLTGTGATNTALWTSHFTSGTLAEYSFVSPTTVNNTNTAFTYAGLTNSAKSTYSINPCNNSNKSDDEYGSWTHPSTIHEVWITWTEYHVTPTGGALIDNVNRKVGFFYPIVVSDWAVIPIWTAPTQSGHSGKLQYGITYNPGSGATWGGAAYLVDLLYDKWYFFKMHIIPNTPSTADGTIEAWYSGGNGLVKILTATNINFRGSNSVDFQHFRFGEQAGCGSNYNSTSGFVSDTRYVGTTTVSATDPGGS